MLKKAIGLSIIAVFLPLSIFAASDTTVVKTGSGSFISKVAPGEFLPVSVKLLNFGGGRRGDVQIFYRVKDALDQEVFSESETDAVETTASFVKALQLPHEINPGRYRVTSEILYQEQEVPAISSFEFTVERKFAGIFLSQLLLFGGLALTVGAVFSYIIYFLRKKERISRINHEYSDVPKDDRIFYEMLSDIITQMRLRVGDKALELALGIEGLVIDGETGRVKKVSKNPAKIIALLVLRYEQELGEKISFSLRQINETDKKKVENLDKNLVVL